MRLTLVSLALVLAALCLMQASAVPVKKNEKNEKSDKDHKAAKVEPAKKPEKVDLKHVVHTIKSLEDDDDLLDDDLSGEGRDGGEAKLPEELTEQASSGNAPNLPAGAQKVEAPPPAQAPPPAASSDNQTGGDLKQLLDESIQNLIKANQAVETLLKATGQGVFWVGNTADASPPAIISNSQLPAPQYPTGYPTQ